MLNIKAHKLRLLLAAGSVLVCCVRMEENFQPEPSAGMEETTVYTLTVQAEKGASTKALTEATDGHTIQSTWKAGDQVDVYNSNNDKIGTLKAATDGASTTLSGSMNTVPEVSEKLTLKYLGGNYVSQQGTLEDIATRCDYATAHVAVTEISGNTITTDPAHFESRQAIVKFTLNHSVSKLFVGLGDQTLTVTPAAETNAFYVAIPEHLYRVEKTEIEDESLAGKQVSLVANGDAVYSKTASAIFETGKFYRVNVTMQRASVQAVEINVVQAPSYVAGGKKVEEAL